MTRTVVILAALGAAAAGLGGCADARQTLGLEKKPGPDEFQVTTRQPLALPPNYQLRPPQPGAPPLEPSVPLQARASVFGTPPGKPGAPPAGTPPETATQPPLVEAPPAPPALPTLPGLPPAVAPPPGAPPAGLATAPPTAPATPAFLRAGAPVPVPPGGAPAFVRRSPGEQALLGRAGAQNSDPGIRMIVDRESRQLAESNRTVIDELLFWRKQPEPGVIVDPQKEADRLKQNQEQGKPPNEGDVPIIKRRSRGILDGLLN